MEQVSRIHSRSLVRLSFRTEYRLSARSFWVGKRLWTGLHVTYVHESPSTNLSQLRKAVARSRYLTHTVRPLVGMEVNTCNSDVSADIKVGRWSFRSVKNNFIQHRLVLKQNLMLNGASQQPDFSLVTANTGTLSLGFVQRPQWRDGRQISEKRPNKQWDL